MRLCQKRQREKRDNNRKQRETSLTDGQKEEKHH